MGKNDYTGFRENGLDVADKYVSVDDADLMSNYLTPEGSRKYISGNLYIHGDNTFGQLGMGDTTNRFTSLIANGTDTWKEIQTGYYITTGIKPNGTLWVVGLGTSGQLGNGATDNVSTFIQVGTDTDWKTVAPYKHVLALKTDGTLWAWGENDQGQLGQGDVVNRSTPVQIGTDTDWLQITSGDDTVFAIKSDGSLWGWGYAGFGVLGDGTSVRKSTPIQIGSDTDWVQVELNTNFVGHAIKTDGTLWTWGFDGTDGLLGQGTNSTNLSTPTKVGTLTDWYRLGNLNGDKSGVIKTDGTLWVWGNNPTGELGLGDQVDRSSPEQVGSLTDWRDCSTGGVIYGLKTDGTLWVSGSGTYNPASATSVSSPVQYGSDTDWKSARTYNVYSAVLKLPV